MYRSCIDRVRCLQTRGTTWKHDLCVHVLMLISLGAASAHGGTWAQFRGATGSGYSNETNNLPTRWSDSEGLLWNIGVAGRANSSPAVTRDRIDVTTVDQDDALYVISYNRRDGRQLRRTKVGQGRLATKGPANLYVHRHNAATPTPVADENHVWAFFGNGLLVCVDANRGEVVWRKDMPQTYGAYEVRFGMASSPRLWRDLLFLECITKQASYVVALQKQTGEQVWKVDRRFPAKDDGRDAYSSPTIAEPADGEPQLLVSGSDHINAYDPATGKQLWVSDGLTIDSPYGRVIASPTHSDTVVVAVSGSPPGGGLGHILAVRADRQGILSTRDKLWQVAQSTPDSSSPVAVGELLFMLSDNGVLSCLDIQSGKSYWRKRLGDGPYHASLVAGDGKVYALSIAGKCTVMSISKEPQVVSVNQLDGTFYATPAISNGVLYLRSFDRLYAIQGH